MATPTTDLQDEIRTADDASETTFGRGDAVGQWKLHPDIWNSSLPPEES